MKRYVDYIITLLICFYPLFYLGLGKRYPWEMLGQHGIAIGMICFFSATLIFLSLPLLFQIDQISGLTLYKFYITNIILAAVVTLSYDYIQYKHFFFLNYHNPYILYALDISWLIFIIYSCLNKIKYSHVFAVACFFIIVHQIVSIYYFPLTVLRSDMLHDIGGALYHFLHGISPYTADEYMNGLPPYLPFTMLSFFPAYVLKIDFRIVALIYWSIGLFLLYNKVKNKSHQGYYALLLIILNPYWLMRHDLYFYAFLLELILIYLYISKLNEVWFVVIVGTAIATLQFMWVLLPFVLLANSRNVSQLLRQTLCSMAIALLIIWFFIGNNFHDFLAVFVTHGIHLPYNMDITFSLATLFYFFSSQIVLYILQIVGCGVICILAVYQYFIKGNRNVVFYNSTGAICYLYFIVTNHFMETYLLIPVLLVLAMVSISTTPDKININHICK